jgi:hypothetical protein
MSTILWFAGFGLMMGSFSFLFAGRKKYTGPPRISVEMHPPQPGTWQTRR